MSVGGARRRCARLRGSASGRRTRWEWSFRNFMRVFGFTGARYRYRGLKKNHDSLCAAVALVNLYQNRKRLTKIRQRLAPLGGVVFPPEAMRGLRWKNRTAES